MSIVEVTRPIVGGVDTHLDVHVAAAVDPVGGLLGVESFPTTPTGYHDLSSWLSSFGPVERVGVEGTGTYGAGLARHLSASGIVVVEVDRPNRQARRRNGKSDELDAIEAARAALSGRATGAAKSATGNVEALRTLPSAPLGRSGSRPSASSGTWSSPHSMTCAITLAGSQPRL
jgi:transposase